MQLTTFLLVAVGLQVSARTASQTITFSGENVPIIKVFKEVKKQTGYLIAYNEELLKHSKPVTISVKNDPLENIQDLYAVYYL